MIMLSYDERHRGALDNLLQASRLATFPSIAAIYGLFHDPSSSNGPIWRQHGSGSVIRIGERLFCLTAAHVLEHYSFESSAPNKLTISFGLSLGKGGPILPLFPPIYYSLPPIDLALCEIPTHLSTMPTVSSVNLSTFSDRDEVPADEIMFLHGFSDSNSYTDMSKKTASSLSSPVFINQCETESTAFDSEIHLCVNWPIHDTHLGQSGTPSSFPPPFGLSGSGVWEVRQSDLSTLWTPASIRFSGVATTAIEYYDKLLITRVKHVQSFILTVLKSSWIDSVNLRNDPIPRDEMIALTETIASLTWPGDSHIPNHPFYVSNR